MNITAQRSDARLFGRPRRRHAEALRKANQNRRRPALEGLEGRQLLAAQSTNIAIIGDAFNTYGSPVSNGGFLPTTGSDLAGFNFTALAPGNVTASNLANYDTVVLNVASSALNNTVDTLSAQAKADLVSFVGNGGKLMIYDSETPTQDYSWLPQGYAFTTNNPGQLGANGTLAINEENTLSSADPTSPKYIDAQYLSTQYDAVGDSNVFVTYKSTWCVDMSARNAVIPTFQPVHTYATYSTHPGTSIQGLFIYNGLDMDTMYYESPTNPSGNANGLRKIWIQELQQGFNPVSPTELPCATTPTGIKLEPATGTHTIGETHTVTATITDLATPPNPRPGVHVTFTFAPGSANAGVPGTLSPANGNTDANGEVSFTYVGANVGTDTIVASYLDNQGNTIESLPVTANWTSNPTPPHVVDNTFYSHGNTTLSVSAPGVLANATDLDPDHTPTAILVSNPSHGTLTLKPDGSFTYTPNAGFVGQDSFQFKASDGHDVGNTATATLSVFPLLGIEMDPATDSGESHSDQITNNPQPTFMGAAEAGSQVQVYVQHADNPALVLIGEATADAQGHWTVTSAMPLPDGSYGVGVVENHPNQPNREAEVSILPNPVVIDTVGPRITGLTYDPTTGVLTPTIQDDRSGLNQASLGDPANYALIKLHTPMRYHLMVASATPSAASMDPTAPQTVALSFVDNQGRSRLGAGNYVAGILSGGLVDKAGNALDGEFTGQPPTGNGVPGGNALAFFLANNSGITKISPVTPQIQFFLNRHEGISNRRSRAATARPALQDQAAKVVVSQAPRPDVVSFLAPDAANPLVARKRGQRN